MISIAISRADAETRQPGLPQQTTPTSAPQPADRAARSRPRHAPRQTTPNATERALTPITSTLQPLPVPSPRIPSSKLSAEPVREPRAQPRETGHHASLHHITPSPSRRHTPAPSRQPPATPTPAKTTSNRPATNRSGRARPLPPPLPPTAERKRPGHTRSHSGVPKPPIPTRPTTSRPPSTRSPSEQPEGLESK